MAFGLSFHGRLSFHILMSKYRHAETFLFVCPQKQFNSTNTVELIRNIGPRKHVLSWVLKSFFDSSPFCCKKRGGQFARIFVYLREKLPKFQEAFPCSNIGICYNIPSAAIYTNHSNFWENRSLVAAHGDDVCVCENGTFLFLLPLSDTFSFLTAFGNHPNCLMEIFALPKMLKITPEDSNFSWENKRSSLCSQ